MINLLWLERSTIPVSLYFLARVLGRWRGSKRQRAALTTPLVDAALLEAVFQPRPKDGDDPNLLAEVRDTLAHLNRQAYAEEFWELPAQIIALDGTLGPVPKATLRRALLRLLATPDHWLQVIGAKTAAGLGFTEAAPSLRALLEGDNDGDPRFRQVLEEALEGLTNPQEARP